MKVSYPHIKEAISKTRTFRRYDSDVPVTEEVVLKLIDVARLGGSARNGQPWQYMAVVDDELCQLIFPHLGWAGYLTNWKGPAPDERPGGYILCILNHDRLNVGIKDSMVDLGIGTQNMLLAATTMGIGGCRIGSISPSLHTLFTIPSHLTIELIIAIGGPAEQVIVDESSNEQDTRYWRDSVGGHHVPKRSLNETLITLARR